MTFTVLFAASYVVLAIWDVFTILFVYDSIVSWKQRERGRQEHGSSSFDMVHSRVILEHSLKLNMVLLISLLVFATILMTRL